MDAITHAWNADGENHYLALVRVAGTGAEGYGFGEGASGKRVVVGDFFIGAVTVTQALWDHVMGPGTNPAFHKGLGLPIENVSWDRLTGADGFLARINGGPIRERLAGLASVQAAFRLPTETEWEYAARGGRSWKDDFRFSGGNDIDAVAWYGRRSGHTHPVASKDPNQLGAYDMSGNIWEWCQDVFDPDPASIPADGTAHDGQGTDRVLRGGCFHNWAEHCTVSKRYAIGSEFHDGCIGFRLVLG